MLLLLLLSSAFPLLCKVQAAPSLRISALTEAAAEVITCLVNGLVTDHVRLDPGSLGRDRHGCTYPHACGAGVAMMRVCRRCSSSWQSMIVHSLRGCVCVCGDSILSARSGIKIFQRVLKGEENNARLWRGSRANERISICVSKERTSAGGEIENSISLLLPLPLSVELSRFWNSEAARMKP